MYTMILHLPTDEERRRRSQFERAKCNANDPQPKKRRPCQYHLGYPSIFAPTTHQTLCPSACLLRLVATHPLRAASHRYPISDPLERQLVPWPFALQLQSLEPEHSTLTLFAPLPEKLWLVNTHFPPVSDHSD
jgi:hypothetical protein